MEIIDYKEEYQPNFEKLNKAWLNKYFSVEPIDEEVLSNPEEFILKQGGQILFMKHNGQIIGTVALKFVDDNTFELTKMAVDDKFQGLGAGKLLCNAAIKRAKNIGATSLILFSETSLAAAIHIYRKLGFKEIPIEKGKYHRANIMMKLELENKKA